jgi:hypothetical protein
MDGPELMAWLARMKAERAKEEERAKDLEMRLRRMERWKKEIKRKEQAQAQGIPMKKLNDMNNQEYKEYLEALEQARERDREYSRPWHEAYLYTEQLKMEKLKSIKHEKKLAYMAYLRECKRLNRKAKKAKP